MMVSDELKRAIETAQKRHPEEAATMLVAVIDALLPRIIALERCRDLLEKHQWGDLEYDGYGEGLSSCPECAVEKPHHTPNCEIAKALETTP